MNLKNKNCIPCEGGVPALTKDQAKKLLSELHEDWYVTEDPMVLSREYKFKNFAEALDFVNKLGAIAEEENHHPDIILKWGFVHINLWTHAIGGLSENDFILAAKVDSL